MALSAGTMVTPNVRLLRVLGRGGMGSVWVADHLTLDTQVAVKFIATDKLGQAGRTQLTRFRREAKAAVKIRSPHVVQIFDYGIMDDGSPYIVMELLEGETLGSRLKRQGAVGPQMTADVITQVAKALSAAHHLGIVHRDIKPDNIYLTKTHDGELMAKVLDFGVAKQSGLGVDQDITSTGSLIGSPKYMSPEQLLSNKDVGASADMWSLAVVAYRGITGVAPFRGDTLAALSIAICNAEYRPPTELMPNLPAEVDRFFERAFAREPEERFATPKALVRAFRAAFHGGVDPLSDSSASLAIAALDEAPPAARPEVTAPAARVEQPAPELAVPAVAPAAPRPERPAARDSSPDLAPSPQASGSAGEPPVAPTAVDAAAGVAGGSASASHSSSADASGSFAPSPAADAEAPPPRAPLDSGVDLTPDSYGAVQPVVQSNDPGSLSGSMASLGGASASLQPPLPAVDRRRLALFGMVGVAVMLLVMIVAISASLLLEEDDDRDLPALATATARLPVRQWAAGARRLIPEPPAGMVAVRSGSYPVGCDPDKTQGCFDDEKPRHAVELERYAIMRHEVTVGEYGKCVAAGKCDKPGTERGCTWRKSGRPSLPVTCVTWKQAEAYCAFRSWRLPTEAEWEVAARGREARSFPWGDALPTCARTVVGGQGKEGCRTDGPLPVGSKATDRSWAGVLDLGGNVREWTANDYAAYPGGKAEPGRSGKITRGTSWSIAPADADASFNRGVDKPERSRPDLGFRCAVTL